MEWIVFIFIIVIIIIVVWIFFGCGQYEFLGLKGMDPPRKSKSSSNTSESEGDTSSDNGVCIIIDENGEPDQKIETSKIKSKVSKADKSLRSSDVLSKVTHISTDKVELSKNKMCKVDDVSMTFSTSADKSEGPVVLKLNSHSVNYYNAPEEKNKRPKKNVNESRGESLCRKVLEITYKKPFPTARPSFLVNPETGFNLELDGYNEELNLAFEYNGVQHYIYPNRFHKTEEDFIGQVRRDQYKKDACKLAGIYLLTIPYNIPYSKIPEFIEHNLPENVAYRIESTTEAPENL